jgi:hypothetical protein
MIHEEVIRFEREWRGLGGDGVEDTFSGLPFSVVNKIEIKRVPRLSRI